MSTTIVETTIKDRPLSRFCFFPPSRIRSRSAWRKTLSQSSRVWISEVESSSSLLFTSWISDLHLYMPSLAAYLLSAYTSSHCRSSPLCLFFLIPQKLSHRLSIVWHRLIQIYIPTGLSQGLRQGQTAVKGLLSFPRYQWRRKANRQATPISISGDVKRTSKQPSWPQRDKESNEASWFDTEDKEQSEPRDWRADIKHGPDVDDYDGGSICSSKLIRISSRIVVTTAEKVMPRAHEKLKNHLNALRDELNEAKQQKQEALNGSLQLSRLVRDAVWLARSRLPMDIMINLRQYDLDRQDGI